jgi:hypothetical protein
VSLHPRFRANVSHHRFQDLLGLMHVHDNR